MLRQLEATTKITEQVKVAVSHEDWIAREWKAIRRTKLEELVETAVSLTRWLDHQRSVLFFSVEQKSPEPPGDRVSMLVALYFLNSKRKVPRLFMLKELLMPGWQI